MKVCICVIRVYSLISLYFFLTPFFALIQNRQEKSEIFPSWLMQDSRHWPDAPNKKKQESLEILNKLFFASTKKARKP